jgi:peptidoglycan hydrolase CwlO-like protein
MAAALARLLPASSQGATPRPRCLTCRARARFAVPTLIRMLRFHVRARAVGVAGFLVTAVLLGSGLTSSSAGDLQSQIAAGKSAASSLQSQIATDSAQIRQTSHGLADATRRLTALQQRLSAREAQLRDVQTRLLAARNRLVDLENQLERATHALAANLVAAYEHGQPNLVSVILDAHGFTQLVEQVNFMHRIAQQNAAVVGWTRATRAAVARQARLLATLEKRDQALTAQVLAQRNGVAALQSALLRQQITELHARGRDATKLHALKARLSSLEAKAAAEAARAAATRNVNVGGIAVDTGGMVQAPPGAPAAVAQVIAAGNAIATLPYIYGGGHASFHADGYDCSGSVSYALAAAGLVSSPMVSGDFEDWGDPGPGRWITIYANAGHVWMEVAGWRFDTVALAEGGTRWSRGGGEFSGFVVRHPPGL